MLRTTNDSPIMFPPENKMKLTSRASEQNVYFTYVCLVNDIKPNDNLTDCEHNRPSFHQIDPEPEHTNREGEPIQVERSKALHELVELHKKAEKEMMEEIETREMDSSIANPTTTSMDESQLSENDDNFLSFDNPDILKLTKMKWLTEDQEGAPDSSSPSLSPASSNTSSNCSRESNKYLNKCISSGDRYLSTILRVDKEHNMFGLSNIAIVGSRPSKKIRKQDDKAVFHQTAIVQICCGKGCCKHKSKTDLPASLKCGGCRGCCVDPSCSICIGACGPCEDPPCQPLCSSCPRGKCICKAPCPPQKCLVDCSTCYGLKITLHRKEKYEPSPVELTPRSSCVLQKPLAARSCHHLPQCVPPSSCFPYLMPCFWPARAGAPCNTPARCFHNPPCPAPRKRKSCIPPEEMCQKTGKCEDDSKKTKCPNQSCPGSDHATPPLHINPGIEKKKEKNIKPKPTNVSAHYLDVQLAFDETKDEQVSMYFCADSIRQ